MPPWYANGQGVKHDDLKAVKWYQKAADQGYARAQNSLGVLYESGQGVKQDYVKAVEWYQKAADQGNEYAQYNLGLLYANGQGVKQDDLKAAEWYQKAADQGHSNAKENLANLNHRLNCKKSASTEIFGIAIKCANRDQLMAAVKNAGASVIREDKNKWGDVYNSSSVLKGSSEFHIDYTVDDRFAKAYYIFPSHMDANQITMVRDFVANKYGNPNSSKGNVSLGNASFEWHLKDGIILTVSRGWPDTTTYLNFTYPKNYQEMMNEYERQRKESEAKQYEKQNNAF
ncbi:tetratricopeptide repeat protein [Shewanella sp.]|uniref:tetratricopeptide repeat protein n=1 Tax=Shewanella sp. TaxID=50422 RepID=UPI003D0BB4AB